MDARGPCRGRKQSNPIVVGRLCLDASAQRPVIGSRDKARRPPPTHGWRLRFAAAPRRYCKRRCRQPNCDSHYGGSPCVAHADLPNNPTYAATSREMDGVTWFARIPHAEDDDHAVCCLYVMNEEAKVLTCSFFTTLPKHT